MKLEIELDDLNTIKKSLNDLSVYVSLHLKLSEETNSKTKVIDSYLNKAISFVNSIFILTSHNQYGESVILYRCLIERFLFLKYIIDNNKYEDFDNWSFLKNFEQKNTIRGFKKHIENLSAKELNSTKEDILKYQYLKKNKPNWKEPDLKKYSQKIGYGYLYKLGYDFGSSYVHGRSDEGLVDFEQKNKIKPKDEIRTKRVLFNSLLISSSIFDECVSNSSLKSLTSFNNYKAIMDNYFENKELLPLKETEIEIANYIFKKATNTTANNAK